MSKIRSIKDKPSALRGVDSAPLPVRLVESAVRAASRADAVLELAAREIGKIIDDRREAAGMMQRVGVPVGHEFVVRELADGAAIAEAAVGRLAQLLGCPQVSRSHGGISLLRVLAPSALATKAICDAQAVDDEAYNGTAGDAA